MKPYIAIGFGKFCVCVDHNSDSQLYRQEILGTFNTHDKASAALYYAREDFAVKEIIAEWKTANAACKHRQTHL